MARQRARTDWQLDLKPVALTPPERLAASNGNGAHPAVPAAALNELRAADNAVLAGLQEIHASVDALRSAIADLSGRVGEIETRLAAQALAPPAKPATPARRRSPLVRETSRTLRSAGTDSPESAIKPASGSTEDQAK